MLRLAHNRLAMLPASIGNLPNLKGLYLDFNRLSRLPEEARGAGARARGAARVVGVGGRRERAAGPRCARGHAAGRGPDLRPLRRGADW